MALSSEGIIEISRAGHSDFHEAISRGYVINFTNIDRPRVKRLSLLEVFARARDCCTKEKRIEPFVLKLETRVQRLSHRGVPIARRFLLPRLDIRETGTSCNGVQADSKYASRSLTNGIITRMVRSFEKLLFDREPAPLLLSRRERSGDRYYLQDRVRNSKN